MKNYYKNFLVSLFIQLLALSAVVIFSGCATLKVNVAGRFPANNQRAANLRRVTIAGFQGRGGSDFAAALETELASTKFDGKPYFTLVGGSTSYGANAILAREYGRKVNANGVYFGQINEQVKNEPQQMEMSKCARWDNFVCKQWYQVPVTCERRTIAVTVTPKLLNIATGEIVYTANKVGQKQTTWCPGETRKSDISMIAEIQRGILYDIRMDVAPTVKILQAKVMDDANGLDDAMSALFEKAVEQVKSGDTQSASKAWTKIHDKNPLHIPTIFNLGVCAESAGHYKKALALYKQAGNLQAHANDSSDSGNGSGNGISDWLHAATAKAHALIDRPENDIATAQVRVEQLIAAQSKLKVIKKEQKAEADLKHRQIAAIKRHQEEEAARERRAAAAAKRRQEAVATAHKQDLITRYGHSAADAILKGKVKNGMSKEAVIASIGKPQHRIAASSSEEEWTYPSKQVIFTNGKVSYVGSN